MYSRKFFSSPFEKPNVLINKINKLVEQVINENKILIEKIKSIGFGIPGTIDSRKGRVIHAPNLRWKNISFFEYYNLKYPFEVYLGQDAKAAVLAEYLFGAGKGCKNLICLTLGTGIGGGIILNGKVYFGSFGTAGEIGHMIVKTNGNKCNCGMRGCLEAHSSGLYILKRAKEIIKDNKEIKTGKDVFVLAKKGNKNAIKIIDEAIYYLGIGLVNILNILGPEKIIISGGLSNQKKLLIDRLNSFVKENGYQIAANKVKVVKAELGEFAPMVGSAMLYRDESFKYDLKL